MGADMQAPYEDLFESAPDGLIVLDGAGLVTLVNPRATTMLGRTRDDVVGKPFRMFLAEPAGGADAEMLARRANHPIEFVLHRPEGETLTVEAIAGQPMHRRPGSVVIALRDVTGRKREEEALRARSRQQALVADLGRQALTGIDRHRLMDEAVRVLVSDLDVEYGNLLELLPDGRAILRAGIGWQADLIGGTTLELTAGTPAGQVILDQAPIVVEDLRSDARFTSLSVAREHGVVSSLTVPIYGPAGPLGVLAVHSARRRPFPEADIHFVQAVANVVALVIQRHRQEERLRERQLIRAEQMAAIGQVAAGVAHEIRNPLTSVKGLVQVNLREADARGLPADDLQVIEHEVRRMERTLQTFLDFARPPRLQRRRLNLAVVVKRVFELVAGRARKQGVALKFQPTDETTLVNGDQDQLQQLVLNLVLNALDAMPEGGALEIDLRSPRDGFVELLVRDSGPGIAPDILPKVFETFVSSKETGIGLGVPVSLRIAEEHGGTLTAFNLPGSGACFVLRLPAAT